MFCSHNSKFCYMEYNIFRPAETFHCLLIILHWNTVPNKQQLWIRKIHNKTATAIFLQTGLNKLLIYECIYKSYLIKINIMVHMYHVSMDIIYNSFINEEIILICHKHGLFRILISFCVLHFLFNQAIVSHDRKWCHTMFCTINNVTT